MVRRFAGDLFVVAACVHDCGQMARRIRVRLHSGACLTVLVGCAVRQTDAGHQALNGAYRNSVTGGEHCRQIAIRTHQHRLSPLQPIRRHEVAVDIDQVAAATEAMNVQAGSCQLPDHGGIRLLG